MKTVRDEWRQKVKRVLTDPYGRAALAELGINVELVGGKNGHEPDSDKPIIAVLCPTYRAPEPKMQDALRAMVEYTREKNICTIYSGSPIQASVVHWSRNWLVSEQIKSGKPWTHVLFIDDDIVVPADALERLLSHRKDIVAGLCTRRNDPPIPNMRFYDKESGRVEQIWDWPAGQLVEVDAVGTGLMLLTRWSLERVATAYFECKYEQEFYGLSGDALSRIRQARLESFDKDKICYWFRFLPTPKHDIEMGEDITFCFTAKRYCELQIFVDTAVLPGHLGPYAYSVHDFTPYRDACIEKAKQEGTYRIQPKIEPEVQLVG